jgi:hypothetical protein
MPISRRGVADMEVKHGTTARLRKDEAKEFRLLFVVGFAIFLMVGVVTRLLPSHWRPHPPGPEGFRSIVSEAKAAANMFIPFAFMG